MTSPSLPEGLEPFEIDVVPDRDRVYVVPRGEIDLSTISQLRERLDELELAGFDCLVLDLRNVSFIDSTGLRLVLEEARKDGIDFAVVPGNATVHRVFEMTGLLDVVPFIEGPRLRG